MIVREMIEEDIGQLAILYEQFWNEKSTAGKMVATFRRIQGDPRYIFLSAIEDDRLAGTILGVVCEELYGDCRPFMVIEDFIVDKDFRRKGIGKALIRELEKRAVANNCCNIILVTESGRKDAQRFYESAGFQKDKYKGYKKSL